MRSIEKVADRPRKIRKLGYQQRKAWTGRLFILPWVIGFVFFFAKPLLQSLYFSFGNIVLNAHGYIVEFTKLKNYNEAIFKDPEYIRMLVEAIQNMVYEVPIIIIFSLFIALLLNQKFKGRFLYRAIFFLPVIITSGIIITILKEDIFSSALRSGDLESSYMFKSSGLKDFLVQSGLNYNLVTYFTDIVNRIFDLTWKSGVQILLFLAGLQSIPSSLYEASDVEGATAWEAFWKITFPMLTPIIFLNIIYSIIDSFTDYGSNAMQYIMKAAFGDFRYGYSCTLAWIFFLCVFVIIGIINALLSKRIYYISE